LILISRTVSILCIAGIFLFPNDSLLAQAVLFGERKLENQDVSLYLDRQGNIYPDYFISDSSLNNCEASLNSWYRYHPPDFGKICDQNGIIIKNFDDAVTQLNEKLARKACRKIENLAGVSSKLTFVTHGFRKGFVEQNRDSTATADFLVMEENVHKYSSSPIVRIYWDATYDCCFSSKFKRNNELFEMFEKAQNQANQVGLGLRRVIPYLQIDTIYLITHSLGARVYANLAFNVTESDLPTPSQSQVNFILIGPALSRAIFDNYEERNTSLTYDNYKWAIVYNRKDFALKKKDPIVGWMGPGSHKYGSTSLGCDCHGDIKKFKKQKRDSTGNFAFFDFKSIGRTHKVKQYFQSPLLKNVMEWVETSN
jgi:hypothetical protein